jgi:hypothetical protein
MLRRRLQDAPRRSKTSTRGSKHAPRRLHDAPRWLQDAQRCLPDAPRRLQDAYNIHMMITHTYLAYSFTLDFNYFHGCIFCVRGAIHFLVSKVNSCCSALLAIARVLWAASCGHSPRVHISLKSMFKLAVPSRCWPFTRGALLAMTSVLWLASCSQSPSVHFWGSINGELRPCN